MPNHQETTLSYALKAADRGWAWWVVDLDGNTVAYGAEADRAAAQAALRRVYLDAAGRGGRMSIAA